jgi:hypothetical protein
MIFRWIGLYRKVVGAGVLLASLTSSTLASAGDPAAHTQATVNAAKTVASAFVNGVGAPSSGCGMFKIPTDAKSNGVAINAPDTWLCTDANQPPMLTEANRKALGNTADESTKLGLELPSWCHLEMTCNYTHFVANPVDPKLANAAQAFQITQSWANDILLEIQGQKPQEDPSSPFSCDVATWNKYWARVLNAAHYAQDGVCGYHATGNAKCGPQDIVPAWQQVAHPYQFAFGTGCYQWIRDEQDQASGESPILSCDDQVMVSGLDGMELPWSAWLLDRLCYTYSAAACMGEERLIRHHCEVAPSSLTCAGPQPTQTQTPTCSIPSQYCEGEICPRPGQDFLTPATNATVPLMQQAAAAWAEVCQQPEDPCDPNDANQTLACENWCLHTVQVPNGLPTSSCATGTCVCGTGNGAGTPTCYELSPWPCGGDLVGTWMAIDFCEPVVSTATGSCIDVGCGGGTIYQCLSDAQLSSQHKGISGTLTFKSDMTYSEDLTLKISASFITPPCPLAQTCSDLDNVLHCINSEGTGALTCSGEPSTACNCEQEALSCVQSETGIYATCGNLVTLGGNVVPLGLPAATGYCVEGNNLRLGTNGTADSGYVFVKQ